MDRNPQLNPRSSIQVERYGVSNVDPPVVRADLKGWKFTARERELFDRAANKLPTWRAANQARKH